MSLMQIFAYVYTGTLFRDSDTDIFACVCSYICTYIRLPSHARFEATYVYVYVYVYVCVCVGSPSVLRLQGGEDS